MLIESCGCGLVTKVCLTLATPWTVAFQVLLSMGFPRQEYQSELPSPGDPPNPGIEPGSMNCRQIINHLSHQGSPLRIEGKPYERVTIIDIFS